MKTERIENFKCEAGTSDSESTTDSYWENASSLPNFLGLISNMIRVLSNKGYYYESLTQH